MKVVRLAAFFVAAMALLAFALPAAADGSRNSGFYDHQIIEYVSSTATASSPEAALQISKGEHRLPHRGRQR